MNRKTRGKGRPRRLAIGPERLEPRALLAFGVYTYHDDPVGSGLDPDETALTPADVAPSSFGKLFASGIDGSAFAQPLYAPGVDITTGASPGVHDVVFVATEHDSLYAFDAETGVQLWKDSLLDPVHGGAVSTVPTSVLQSPNLGTEEGITSTPVIDPSTGTIYVLAETREVVGGVDHYIQQLHAIAIGTGREKFGGPEVVADTTFDGSNYGYVSGPSVSGTGTGSVGGVLTYNALRQSQRVALADHDGTIWVVSASQGDVNPYHGWILGYNASNLQPVATFVTTPNGNEGGIWLSGGEIAFDDQGNMFLTVGNGTFDGSNGGPSDVDSGGPGPITGLNAQGFPIQGDYGDAILKLAPDPSTTISNPGQNGYGLKVVDYFVPDNQAYLVAHDVDFGSQGVAFLPDSAGSVAHPHLLEDAGKEGKIYLVDRDDLGKFGTTTDDVVQEIPDGLPGGSYATPATFGDSIYEAGNGDPLEQFQVSNAVITPVSSAESPDSFPYPGASPSISSDGASDAIVWALSNGASNQLRAYDATNLSDELYTSDQAPGGRDALLGSVNKFTSPTIADGRVFVATSTGLVGYGLLNPPSTVQVDLSAASNRRGVVADGSKFVGGLDGRGLAYSSNLLGSTITAGGSTFALVPPGGDDAVSAQGQTIALPSGDFSTLSVLGTAVGGPQLDQTFVVHYTDGTSQTFSQSLSGWFRPRSFPGESIAATTRYGDTSRGRRDPRNLHLYEYGFTIDPAKTIASITLPRNRDVEILAIDLT